jgi:hypothetical protein
MEILPTTAEEFPATYSLLLFTTIRYYPLRYYLLLSVTIRYYPLLSVAIRYYPSLSLSIRCYPLLSVTIHHYPLLSVAIRCYHLPSLTTFTMYYYAQLATSSVCYNSKTSQQVLFESRGPQRSIHGGTFMFHCCFTCITLQLHCCNTAVTPLEHIRCRSGCCSRMWPRLRTRKIATPSSSTKCSDV